jgi:hypothetical protein
MLGQLLARIGGLLRSGHAADASLVRDVQPFGMRLAQEFVRGADRLRK